MMKRFIDWLRSDERGQGMVEYALIIALVAVLLIVAITPMREAIAATFGDITTELNK